MNLKFSKLTKLSSGNLVLHFEASDEKFVVNTSVVLTPVANETLEQIVERASGEYRSMLRALTI